MSRFSYRNRPLGLYLHIPFCVSKCGYCDFYSVTDRDLMRGYVSALLGHIREYGRTCSGYTVDTVYIGGGTPTARDRVMATRMGYTAVEVLLAGKTNRVICSQHGSMVDVDIEEGLSMKKGLNQQQCDALAAMTGL